MRFFEAFLLALCLLSCAQEQPVDSPDSGCTPACEGKGCGSDGCGGQCAPGCEAGESCNDAGQCASSESCGGEGQLCCVGSTCRSGLVCDAGSCEIPTDCGRAGQLCCIGSTCSSGLVCNGGTCESPTTCGGTGQPCCSGSTCSSGLVCNDGVCGASCGGPGERCCANERCDPGYACADFECQATCGSSSDCDSARPYCDEDSTCKECFSNIHCPFSASGAQQCEFQKCVTPPCLSKADCGAGEDCVPEWSVGVGANRCEPQTSCSSDADCVHYRCQNGRCRTSCDSDSDCKTQETVLGVDLSLHCSLPSHLCLQDAPTSEADQSKCDPDYFPRCDWCRGVANGEICDKSPTEPDCVCLMGNAVDRACMTSTDCYEASAECLIGWQICM